MIDRFRDLAAAERTFLAWIRTAVSIVGFGVVIEQLSHAEAGSWVTIGTIILVGLGAMLILFAALHFLRVRHRILSDDPAYAYGVRFQIVFTLMIAVLVVLLTVFMLHLSRAPA